MSTPFLSEIKIMSFGFPPKGWALCDGQLLPINQNQALFSLLGTTYGGDGRVNFGLPNLQGRMPIHMGNGFTLGERGGEENHTLITTEMPAHTHAVAASSNAADQGSPGNNFWAYESSNAYSAGFDSSMSPAIVNNVGGSQPHLNLSPFLTLSFCIALQGIFPSQN
ncbi:MAG TPA: tail fiber protein [Verrucomicrobiae bacterium]|nr:tail fiber protein [Verrucomicrobiae bacterium]